MRILKVTYRAIFEQPLGRLNPLNARLAGPIGIEIYESRLNVWKFRRPGTTAEFELLEAASADSAKVRAAEHFERQLEQWRMWGNPGGGARPIEPDEITFRNDHVYLLEPDDYTHFSDLSKRADRKKGFALCGAELKLERFVPIGLSVATCRTCAAAADKMKEAKA